MTDSQTCLILRDRLRAFRAAGFHVTLVCSPGPHAKKLASEEDIDFLPVFMRRGISPLADLACLLRLWALLSVLRPDVTEFSTPKAGLLGSLAAILSGVRSRVYLLRGLRLETASGFTRGLLLWSERIAAAASHVVLCNSESLRARAIALGVTSARKLCVLGSGSSNGVDVERFHPGTAALRPWLFIPRAAPVVGFVGRLTCDKGIPELIEAFDLIQKSYPTARLLLVGWFDDSDDALSEDWRARIRNHPQIVMTGFAADTAPLYRAMDVLVLPTLREGMPNAALEASASGVPVVTTFATGSRDAVVPEVTGLLIPPGYPEAIAEAVCRLLGDPALRVRMGEAARRWVRERFWDQHVLGRTVDFYLGLVTGQGVAEPPRLSEEAALAAK